MPSQDLEFDSLYSARRLNVQLHPVAVYLTIYTDTIRMFLAQHLKVQSVLVT